MTTPNRDHYLPGATYRRLLGELIALQANRGPRHGDPQVWAVKFLAVAGIWSEGIRAEADALEAEIHA